MLLSPKFTLHIYHLFHLLWIVSSCEQSGEQTTSGEQTINSFALKSPTSSPVLTFRSDACEGVGVVSRESVESERSDNDFRRLVNADRWTVGSWGAGSLS